MADPTWVNRTIWTADNLDVLRGMNSASVDLIYLDPPFNSKKTYSAPIGSKAAGAAFKDTWTLSDLDHRRTCSRNCASAASSRRRDSPPACGAGREET